MLGVEAVSWLCLLAITDVKVTIVAPTIVFRPKIEQKEHILLDLGNDTREEARLPLPQKKTKTNLSMKKRLLLIVWALGVIASAHALTLEECLQLARENYPAIKQYDLILASKDYDLSNAGKAWLPKLSVEAGA